QPAVPPPPPPPVAPAGELSDTQHSEALAQVRQWAKQRAKEGRTPSKRELLSKLKETKAEMAAGGPAARRSSSRAQSAKPDLRRSPREPLAAPVAAAIGATAASGIVETKGWGCLGCLGQITGIVLLSFMAMVAVDIGLSSFVSSEAGVALSGRDPETAAQGRALRSRLISFGPSDAPVVAVLALDPNDADSGRILRETLSVLRPGERRKELPRGGRIRLVILPTGQSEQAGGALLALHRKGQLITRAKKLRNGPINAKSLLRGMSKRRRAAVRAAASKPAIRLQARGYATMATALGMSSPQLLFNGVRIHRRGLRNRAALAEMTTVALTGTRASMRHMPRVNEAYWNAVLSPLKPRIRERFYGWMVKGERVPSAPLPKAQQQKKVPVQPKKKPAKAKAPAHVKFAIPPTAPRLGPNTAAVRIVVFADLRCPFCRKLAPRLAKLRTDYGDDVQLVFMHYPLKMHPGAGKLAQLAVAAHGQQAFWPLYNYLHTPAGIKASPKATERWLRDKGHMGRTAAARARWKQDLRVAPRVVARHRKLGRKLKVRGTPTTFINGWRVNGAVSYTKLRALVDQQMKSPKPPVDAKP
ncbi:MAG: DsbA family protein, partial [Myxococcales bacterium]|nr:DsbA family protein [Myxococcales bacterium]